MGFLGQKVFPALKRISLTNWIILSLFAGVIIGVWIPQLTFAVRPFQTIFIHGIKCAVAPLIFSTIVIGVTSAGNFRQLGIMGIRTFVYFEIITTLALGVGLFAVNLLKPGVGVHLGVAQTFNLTPFANSKITFSSLIANLIPLNIADAVARGDVLQIVIFSTLFALGALAAGDKAKPVLLFCEGLAQIMFKFVGFIMYLAPLGVCASVAVTVSENGWQIILPLLKLVGTLYFAFTLFIFFVLYPVCKLYKIPALQFLKSVKEPVLFAFATTSSESAYPAALESLRKFGVPGRIASFVLPMGYSFNLDGSTLYLSLAAVFVAQTAGISLSLSQQLLIMFTLMLTTKGVAAVPRASIVVLSGTLTAFGLPLEGIGLILGVDAFMDMGRSAINLLGNCLAAAVIARSEKIPLGITSSTEELAPAFAKAPLKT